MCMDNSQAERYEQFEANGGKQPYKGNKHAEPSAELRPL